MFALTSDVDEVRAEISCVKKNADYRVRQYDHLQMALYRVEKDAINRYSGLKERLEALETAAQHDITHDCSTERSQTVGEKIESISALELVHKVDDAWFAFSEGTVSAEAALADLWGWRGRIRDWPE